ncbi:hypothetical protein [Pontibacter vulgaris]|uniref:hypothetical protein n=1 Tax=Pontibacter vulgaris TaxID=2905679 RepID=UPI001FA80A2A|nr:hypothetical protein [Pontibacter vulgaris]
MPSHVHLIFRAKANNPSVLPKELKTYTSKQNRKPLPSTTRRAGEIINPPLPLPGGEFYKRNLFPSSEGLGVGKLIVSTYAFSFCAITKSKCIISRRLCVGAGELEV